LLRRRRIRCSEEEEKKKNDGISVPFLKIKNKSNNFCPFGMQ
jgi:hypothetical protein